METAFKQEPRNKNFEVDLNRLDNTQRSAIENDSDNIVIKAPAGSGKTNTLITAVAAYRYDNINDRICAITYTRAARAEMEERLHNMGIFDVEVTTIHVWARKQLEAFGIKYDFKISILQEGDIKMILNDICEDYRRKNNPKIKVNLGILYSWVCGNKIMDISDNYRRMLAILEGHYIKYKRDNQLYDFTDYPLYLWDVLEYYHEDIRGIDALFVDEFQDVDETQFNIFKKVVCKKKFFIGDPWQSIFVFRGADGAIFTKLDDFDLYKLKYNYRSYQCIVDYASEVYQRLKPFIEDEDESCISAVQSISSAGIHCARGDSDGSVSILDPFGNNIYINNKDVVKHLSNEQAALQFYKVLNQNPMVLCRTNKRVKEIQEMGYTNVSTIHQAKGLEYDNVIVIDHPITSMEDLNVAYVALTRARDNLIVCAWGRFEQLYRLKDYTRGWDLV